MRTRNEKILTSELNTSAHAKKFVRYLGIAALICAISPTVLADDMVNVTFHVPVRIQNIHSDWSKFAVYCSGEVTGTESGHTVLPGYPSMQQVGIVDVSNKSRDAVVDVTVTGTIQVAPLDNSWVCELRIQHKGETGFTYIFGRSGQSAEFKATANDRPRGNF